MMCVLSTGNVPLKSVFLYVTYLSIIVIATLNDRPINTMIQRFSQQSLT